MRVYYLQAYWRAHASIGSLALAWSLRSLGIAINIKFAELRHMQPACSDMILMYRDDFAAEKPPRKLRRISL